MLRSLKGSHGTCSPSVACPVDIVRVMLHCRAHFRVAARTQIPSVYDMRLHI
jgi:hypothetical protein